MTALFAPAALQAFDAGYDTSSEDLALRSRCAFLQDFPPEAKALVGLGALACWGGFLHVRRRLRTIQ